MFDYRSPTVVSDIRSAAPDIRHVFDRIGNSSSSATASQAVSEERGILCTVRPGKAFTEKVESRVKVADVLVFSVFLKDHWYMEFKWPVSLPFEVFGGRE